MTPARLSTLVLAAAVVAGCAGSGSQAAAPTAPKQPEPPLEEAIRPYFKEHGQAGLDRLHQDEMQAACSRRPSDGPLPASESKRLVAAQQATIAYPADASLLGDWQRGEKIAQSGVGKQYSDDPTKESGGNCYACHQLTKKEVSFGTLGPSLYQYGKLRGQSPAMQRYTYGKIYNAQAFAPCSIMPRFGHNHVLTEQQMKDLVGLLLDPASPVNQ
jgi:sulfur-oxidizing protein SoxX